MSSNVKSYFESKMPNISGNAVNGEGEKEVRRASPFFWHKPDLHDFGELQLAVTEYQQRSEKIREVFNPKADRGPKPVPQAALSEQSKAKSPQDWQQEIKQFALDNDSDLVGMTRLDPLWLYEGFNIEHPWIIVIGVAMDHEKLSQVPPTFENPSSAVEVGDKYNKAARACRKLANHILSLGYSAKAYQGPYASALNMIPAALAAGLGELGKHGSIINRQYGSNFRLSAISTNMPFVGDKPDQFGADEFCINCQVCRKACPPDAIHDKKVLVRGVNKWYVDFDKCIPFFGEALGCAACIASCPWSTPDRAPRLAEKWAIRKSKTARTKD